MGLPASMLDRLIEHNDRIPLTPTSLTRFHSRAPPTINVCDYLLRIARYTNVESACLLILLNYVDKGPSLPTSCGPSPRADETRLLGSLRADADVHDQLPHGAQVRHRGRQRGEQGSQ